RPRRAAQPRRGGTTDRQGDRPLRLFLLGLRILGADQGESGRPDGSGAHAQQGDRELALFRELRRARRALFRGGMARRPTAAAQQIRQSGLRQPHGDRQIVWTPEQDFTNRTLNFEMAWRDGQRLERNKYGNPVSLNLMETDR